MEQKVIIYNIKALPNSMTVEEVLEIYHATGVILHNSNNRLNAPYSLDVNNLDKNIIFIDDKT